VSSAPGRGEEGGHDEGLSSGEKEGRRPESRRWRRRALVAVRVWLVRTSGRGGSLIGAKRGGVGALGELYRPGKGGGAAPAMRLAINGWWP
jgi:hypothetical protein